jgi:hypothetical protein
LNFLPLSDQSGGEVAVRVIWQAMNRLEAEAGGPINKYATETGAHLVPYA